MNIAGLARRRRVDIVFPRARVAVFVDSYFWHSCPLHGSMPKTYVTFWREKLETKVRLNDDSNRRLEELGWTVIRVWEYKDPHEAATRIARCGRGTRDA